MAYTGSHAGRVGKIRKWLGAWTSSLGNLATYWFALLKSSLRLSFGTFLLLPHPPFSLVISGPRFDVWHGDLGTSTATWGYLSSACLGLGLYIRVRVRVTDSTMSINAVQAETRPLLSGDSVATCEAVTLKAADAVQLASPLRWWALFVFTTMSAVQNIAWVRALCSSAHKLRAPSPSPRRATDQFAAFATYRTS